MAESEIAIFIRALEGGGAQRDAVLLANALADRIRRVTILTLQEQGHLRALVAPSVAVGAVGADKLRSSVPALRRTIARVAPHVLLSSEAAANVIAFLAVRSLPAAARPRIVLREVTSPSLAARTDPYLQNRLAYKVLRPIFARADRVVTLTEGARRDLERDFRVPPERIAVMRSNAVLEPSLEARLAAAAREDQPREPGLIVTVGRLSPEKDQISAVEALAAMGSAHPARLVLVGEGPLREAITGRAEALGVAQRVTLVGHSNDPFAWLLRAQVSLCSSRFEGFGNAIVESLACGTPVVSTDCPWGPREILAGGRWGDLVPVGDTAGLAAALARQMEAPPDRASLRERASAFTSAAAATAFLDIVATL